MEPRLLFDQNLSPRLLARLAEVFPASQHVRDLDLKRADDLAVWHYARDHGLTIVTKDDDFRQLSFLHGAPPKVIWTRIGNCRTEDVERLLLTRLADVTAFFWGTGRRPCSYCGWRCPANDVPLSDATNRTWSSSTTAITTHLEAAREVREERALPPIEVDDVSLVVWLAVEAQA